VIHIRVAPLALLLSLMVPLACQPEEEEAQSNHDPVIRAEDGVLLDRQGRQVLLRGLNARVNGLFDVTFDDGRVALEEIPTFTGEDCKFMAAELGFNLLRLPVNWSGVEPRKGQYNQAYLKKAEQLITACHPHGIFTIVDLHQDAWSKEIGEDGAPLWAIVPPPTKLLQGPLKDLDQRRLSSQVLAAFASFFDNKQGLQDAYSAMAVTLARALAHLPGFVGLELMNEPVLFGGDHKLDAFHRKVGEALREALPGLSIYFEPNSLRNMTDDAPVRTPYPLKNSVYAPHIYTGVFTGNWKSGDVARIRSSVQKAQKEAAAHKAPLWIGEFGNDPGKALGREWITAALSLFDEARASWAFWLYEEHSQGSWGFFDTGAGHTRGKLRKDLVKIMARPFPARLAGRLKSMAWDAASRTLTVKMERPLKVRHLFTVPGKTYPSGAKVTCDGKAVTTETPRPGRALFTCEGSTITVAP